MITSKNLNEVRKEILKLKNDGMRVVVQAQDDEFNRKIVENSDVDVLFGLEIHNRRDYLKQRDSGLNEVLCKLAKKNGVKIGVDLKGLVKLNGVEKAWVLARIMQNVRLCRRVGTEIIVIDEGLRGVDVRGLFSVLGASSEQVRILVKLK